LRLSQRTVLPMTEKRIKETRIGQKDVWTAKKGLRNIRVFWYKKDMSLWAQILKQ
jgi:hypothetical protein